MKKYTVVYYNGKNVYCSQIVKAVDEEHAKQIVIKNQSLFRGKVNSFVSVTEFKVR